MSVSGLGCSRSTPCNCEVRWRPGAQNLSRFNLAWGLALLRILATMVVFLVLSVNAFRASKTMGSAERSARPVKGDSTHRFGNGRPRHASAIGKLRELNAKGRAPHRQSLAKHGADSLELQTSALLLFRNMFRANCLTTRNAKL